jgi:hypothetical protein
VVVGGTAGIGLAVAWRWRETQRTAARKSIGGKAYGADLGPFKRRPARTIPG